MNERIKKLAEQARQEFLKLPTGYKPEQVGMHPQLMEKFAELIVKECAGACLHDDWEDPRWGRFYANKIKEHFGVEE